jgi:hypothetical protein
VSGPPEYNYRARCEGQMSLPLESCALYDQEGTAMYSGDPVNNMYPYGNVAAMLVLRDELQKMRSEAHAGAVWDSVRFAARKIGILLIKVGSRLEHTGYPHVSSTQL